MANFIQQLKVGSQTYDLYDSEFIVDTRATSGSALTGISKASELFDGMQITYWLAYASGNNATLNLTLSNSTTTGAIPCYYNSTTRLGTQYKAGNAIQFVYRTNVTIGGTTIASGWWVTGSIDMSAYLPIAGGTMTGRISMPGVPITSVFAGTGTAAYDAGSDDPNRYHPAIWTFNSGFTATDGDTFTIKIPVAGHTNGVYLSVDNGTTYYPIVLGTTARLTTQYGVDTYITVIFEPTASAASIYPINGGTDRVTITGGAWRVLNYYDANTNTLQRTYRSPTNVELPIAGISTAGSSTAAYSAISANSYKDVYGAIPNDTTKIATINPSTGAITIKNLTASQSISTDANKKLVSTNLSVSSATDETTEATRFVHSVTQSAVGKITVKTRPMPSIPSAPTVGTLNLTASWSGSGPYTQTVTITGSTSNSKIDLQPDATVLTQMMNDGTTAMYVENSSGVFTVYALGAAPTVTLTIQYVKTEVA